MTLTDQTPAPNDRPSEDRAQVIREHFRNAIIERRLAPGTRLPESEVGALFDVSRTVVRSALQMLTFEGLVRSERNRGAFVATPSPDEAREVFIARRLVEPGVAAHLCGRVGPDEIAAFRAHLESEASLMNERGPQARRAEIRASGDFHLLLASVLRNDTLYRFLEELTARSSLIIALYGRSGASSCGHDEHNSIVDALEVGNPDQASALMKQHIDHIEADLDLRLTNGLPLSEALRLP